MSDRTATVLEKEACARAAVAQTPCVVWLTGPIDAARSAVAHAVERYLVGLGRHVMLLDSDQAGESGAEGAGRLGDVVTLLHDAGLVVVVAAASPLRADRNRVAASLPPGRFIEALIDSSDAGNCDPAYQPPLSPGLSLSLDKLGAEAAAEYVVQAVVGREWRRP